MKNAGSQEFFGKTAPRRSTVLNGRKEVCAFLGRSWKTVKVWIGEGAPIAKVEGRIEADSEALLAWRRAYIEKAVSGTGTLAGEDGGGIRPMARICDNESGGKSWRGPY